MKLQKELQMLDAKLFRAFMAAAEAENFTSAAKMIYMTQSGISQHIARLEEQVGVSLFKRIGKRVVLTEAGRHLQNFIEENIYFTEMFLDSLREGHDKAAGRVSYAMPASCLLLPYFSMMLQKRRHYPDIQLDVTLAPSADVLAMVLDNKVDFGFTKTCSNHPSLKFDLFRQEEYILVGADEDQIKAIDGDNIFTQPCIIYPGVEVYFDRWLKHHFSGKRNIEFLDLVSAGHFSSIEGAIKMVEGGLGVSLFPRHCVEKQLEDGMLFEYVSNKPPLLSEIYIVKLAGHPYPRAVRQVIGWFLEIVRQPAALAASTDWPDCHPYPKVAQ